MIGPHTLDISQGSVLERLIAYRPGGVLADLTGYVVRAHIKAALYSPDPLLELTCETGEWTETVAGEEKTFNIRVSATADETAGLGRSGVWDLELVPPSGEADRFTLLAGRAALTKEATVG